LEILFESNQLLVINKPAGLSSDPQWDYPSAEGEAQRYLKEKYGRPAKFLALAHRLDRPVSGVLLLAKKKSVLKELQDHWADPSTQKVYLALTERPLPEAEGQLVHYLRTDRAAKKAIVSEAEDGGARRCALTYRRLGEGPLPQCFLSEIRLHTGRYHQIRAQLAAVGCPLLGDVKYGSTRTYREQAIALHAAELHIELRGESVTFTAAAPWI
jgi:23S rRNA pseudouridine1911/1915/1917 synthase